MMSRQNNEVKEIENWEDFQIAVKLYDRVHDEKLEKLSKERRQLITKEQGQKNNNTFPTSEEIYQKIFVNAIKQVLSKRELSYQLDKTSPLKERYSYLINSTMKSLTI